MKKSKIQNEGFLEIPYFQGFPKFKCLTYGLYFDDIYGWFNLLINKSITVQNYCTADHNFGSHGGSLLFYILFFESSFVLFLSYLFQTFLK